MQFNLSQIKLLIQFQERRTVWREHEEVSLKHRKALDVVLWNGDETSSLFTCWMLPRMKHEEIYAPWKRLWKMYFLGALSSLLDLNRIMKHNHGLLSLLLQRKRWGRQVDETSFTITVRENTKEHWKLCTFCSLETPTQLKYFFAQLRWRAEGKRKFAYCRIRSALKYLDNPR